MAWTVPFHLLGINTSGDVGDVTLYTNKNQKVVAFPKDWRQEKISPARLRCRNRFRAAQASWQSLSDPAKQLLELACRILSIPMTGQNLWVSTALTGDHDAYRTVGLQAAIILPDPPPRVPDDV